MKKLIVGLAGLGALVALRPALRRRMAQKMQAHCQHMASKCQEMVASQTVRRGEPRAMPEHCKQKAGPFKAKGEPTGAADHPEPKAPQFVGHEEAVGAG